MTTSTWRRRAVVLLAGAALAAATGCDQVGSSSSSTCDSASRPERASLRPSVDGRASPPQTQKPGDAASSGWDPSDRRVVVISVDGLNPEALGEPARTPTFAKLRRTGASTLNARTVYESTSTLPNHASMMTGLPVDAPNGHGVTFNWDNGTHLHQATGRYIAGIYDVVHDQGGSTALYASKDKFCVLERAWDADTGAADQVGSSDGRDKIDTFLLADPESLVDELVRALPERRTNLTFLHLGLPDAEGHRSGFMSREYLEAVERTDELLGRVLETVHDDRALRRSTVVVVTADHGGDGPSGHSEPGDASNFTIPFIAWGAGVAQGADLYALNRDRQDPGEARPDYAGAQPIRNMDVANLALAILGLPPLSDPRVNGPLQIS